MRAYARVRCAASGVCAAQAQRAHLSGLFEWLVPVSLRWVRRETREACPTLDANLVQALMRMFSTLTKHFEVSGGPRAHRPRRTLSRSSLEIVCFLCGLQDPAAFAALSPERVTQHVEAVFLFSLVWSVGGTGATNENRLAFDAFFRKAVASQLADYEGPTGER